MKKTLLFFLLAFVFSCSQENESSNSTEKNNTPTKASIDISETEYSFDINNLSSGCDIDSEIVCTINNSIKCTINPHFEDCASAKNTMPSFIFMEDENLKRPTVQSYKISKIKPLPNGNIEVYTKSSCNGNWFGLCNGTIIYIMNQKDGKWIIKEIYAIES